MKIQETVRVMYGEEFTTEEEYEEYSNLRAWTWGGGVILYTLRSGEIERDESNGRGDYFYLKKVERLQKLGYQISKSLRDLAEQQRQEKDAYEEAERKDLEDTQKLAAESGKPVVWWSMDYQTTAATGTRYGVILPSGDIVRVNWGGPTGSPTEATGFSGNATSEIKAAIEEYEMCRAK